MASHKAQPIHNGGVHTVDIEATDADEAWSFLQTIKILWPQWFSTRGLLDSFEFGRRQWFVAQWPDGKHRDDLAAASIMNTEGTTALHRWQTDACQGNERECPGDVSRISQALTQR